MFDWLDEFEEEAEESIGIKGLPSGTLPAGVGYLIIPIGIDPDIYIEDAIRSGRVSMYGGLGHGDFHKVPVDREVLQRIKFPTKVGEHGSPVVWIKIPKHNSPVIVATLKHDDEFHQLRQFQKRITKTDDEGNMVDIDLNPADALMRFTVNAKNQDLIPEISFKINGVDNSGRLIVEVQGEILMRANTRFVILADKKIELGVTGYDNINKARMVLDSTPSEDESNPVNRFLYEDEYNNKVYINEKKIQIKADDSSKITFGEDGDKTEPLIKGETMKSKLEDILDAINQITVPTAFGPSGTPINAPVFTQIKTGLKDILSELTSTD